MGGMDEQLHQQDRIAARCRLIEPQIEGFKVNIILILASLSKQNSICAIIIMSSFNKTMPLKFTSAFTVSVYNVHYYNNNSCCSSAYPE